MDGAAQIVSGEDDVGLSSVLDGSAVELVAVK